VKPDVLIVGAGVSGLTTGVVLAEQGRRVLVRTAELPAATSSAAAGAIWEPIYAKHPKVKIWAARSYEVFEEMALHRKPGVRLVGGIEASRAAITVPDWATTLPGYQECLPADLPPGFATGWRYRAPIIDMPPYLEHLLDRLRAAGGVLRPVRVERLEEGFAEAAIVVNCSGAAAGTLVPDDEVEPIRGQLVAIRNPGITEFFAEHTDDLREMTYLLPQGDVLLLGGNAEKGESTRWADPAVAKAIVERCADIFPEVRGAENLGDRVGIRPGRTKVRLEHRDLGDRHIVHNYGHGGAGVSLSWACAEDVARIVSELSSNVRP
jgi:D-amino-acid oxidase